MGDNNLNIRIKNRYDTEANWTKNNPVLLAGETAYSSDKSGKYKIGDGTHKWSELSYAKADLVKSDVTSALGYTPPTSNTWRGIQNNLTSTATDQSLSAAQGKILKDLVDGKLSLSGGTMTGNISYKGSKATYTMIRFIDNTSDAYGNGIAIGGGGLTIVGGGESADAVTNSINSGGSEQLVLANDGAIDFYTNVQNGIDKATHVTIDNNGLYSGTAASANAAPWSGITGKPTTYPPSSHNHNIESLTNFGARVYDASASRTKNTVLAAPNGSDGKATFRALVAADLPSHTHSYLPLAGGTMTGTAMISWPDSGNWSNSNKDVTFPVKRGGLSWTGQSDGIQLFAEETANDNLELILRFTDDNSNGLTIRNASGTKTARISASGYISAAGFTGNLTGTADSANAAPWSGITGKPSTYPPSSHTHNYAGSSSAGGIAYNANALYKNPSARQTSANYDLTNDAYAHRVTYSIASSSMTTAKPPTDAHILTFGWDTNAGYGAQIAVGNAFSNHLYVRGAKSETKDSKNVCTWESNWRTVLDSDNYTSYTVTKTGSGASGTWGINISGNANTVNYLNIVANNEIRFVKPSSAIGNNALYIGHTWSDGTKSKMINEYRFCGGDGNYTQVTASQFNGSLNGTANKAILLAPAYSSSTLTTASSTWRNGVTEGKVVWGQSWVDTSLSTDSGDLTIWIKKSGNVTTANMTIDGTITAASGFIGSLSGNASTATALTTSAGSATQPVYFSGGKPVATTYTLAKSVPADAKFTDTNTWRGVQNNLTSTATDQSLAAAQGKALNEKKMGAVSANGFYGMARPDGNTSDWIRTTTNGIIPTQSGSRGSGHSALGTDSWYFNVSYIDHMYSTDVKIADKVLLQYDTTNACLNFVFS